MGSLPIQVRPGRPEEAAALSALALRSKAHWGYDEAFMDACRDELTIAPEDVLGDRLMVAELDGSPAGFVTLEGTPPDGELGFLFVDAPFMGRGAGRTPFAAAVATAHREGFATFVVAADPDAEGFYLRMGCRRVGTIASGSIPDRRIPQLKFGLS